MVKSLRFPWNCLSAPSHLREFSDKQNENGKISLRGNGDPAAASGLARFEEHKDLSI
jgi:hypothetical protein